MKSRKLAKKICSLTLALAMALCCLPAAFAVESTIKVDFSFYDGKIVIPKTEIMVYDGIAEDYGYEVASTDHNGNEVDGATAFDVIVAAHKDYYGDKFTLETCGNYLEISSSFVTKVFGVNSSSLGLLVNNEVPNDGIFVEAYGGYTGYSFDTAEICDSNYISLYTYQNSYYADYCAVLSEDKIEVETNRPFILSACGYSAMWYGTSTDEVKAQNTYKLAGLDVYTTKDFITYSAEGKLNENGEITLSFNEEGTVYVCFMGNFEDPAMGTVPVVANWCEVSVMAPVIDEPADNPDGYSDAIYIPYRLDISVVSDVENECIGFNVSIDMKDIKSYESDKTENIYFEINISLFYKIVRFISDIF